MNPMIRKELNLRMRERRGWILPSLYLIALGGVGALVYFMATSQPLSRPQGSDLGVMLFITAAYTQLVLLLLLAPVFSAGALTIEKEQRTMASLLTSLLTSFQIWWGKFVASLLFVMLLILLGIPILSLAFAFGGIGPWEVGMATLTTIITIGAVGAVGLYWSSVFRRSIHATAVSYATIITLTVVTFIIFMISMSTYGRNGATWTALPLWMKVPLYLNPIFFLTSSFATPEELYPEWYRCLAAFLILSTVAVALSLRNIRKSGESL